MFGLPAAALAIAHSARPERRKAVMGMMISLALTSFVTGVTEPIEFTFMFLAPSLYAVHAVLTGAAMVTMHLLGVKLGFGFSAGFFDYALNFGKATHPLYLFPVGLAYFGLYYGLFRYFIVRFDLRTPGREREETQAAMAAATDAGEAAGFVAALGGGENLRQVDACTTRLRLVLADRARVDAEALRRLGARGTVNIGDSGLQVVVGPIADQLAGEIRAHLAADGATSGLRTQEVLRSLGGAANIEDVQGVAGRVIVRVRDSSRLDEGGLEKIFERGIALPGERRVHLLHDDAALLASEMGSGYFSGPKT